MNIIEEVEAIYAGGGPPARSSVVVGGRIKVSRLAIECLACGMKTPQSRSRQAPAARRLWVELHLACGAKST